MLTENVSARQHYPIGAMKTSAPLLASIRLPLNAKMMNLVAQYARSCAHVAGGLIVLAYIVVRVWRRSFWPTRKPAIEAAALYWHCMDVLWLAILALLIFLG